jgi:phage terminase large subunit
LILEAIRDYKRVAVRSCHGIGKSWLAAQVILWFLISFFPAIVLSTAPTFRQVEKLVWKEVRASFHKATFKVGKLQPKSPELQIQQDQWYAVGLSTNDPNRFQGFHEENILVVIDEAPGVDEDIHEAVQGVLTSANGKLFMTGNPTPVAGSFFNAFSSDLWKTFHIAAWDSPNFTAFGVTEEDLETGAWKAKQGDKPLVNPNLITPAWAAEMLQLWGKDSPAYQVRVAGNFPKSGTNALIPLDWVERAMERWLDTEDDDLEGQRKLGVDVARFGDDDSVIAPLIGTRIMPLQYTTKQDTMWIAGLVIQAMEQYDVEAEDVNIDEAGLGAGPVDRLHEQDISVVGVNTGSAANDPKKFFNLRTELWCHMRDVLNPNSEINPYPLALPDDNKLRADLCAPKYEVLSDGRIKLEPKEKTKERLRRSPDAGDAAVLALGQSRFGHVIEIEAPEKESRWKNSGSIRRRRRSKF